MRALRAPVRFCKPSFGEKGEKKRTEHGFLERKKVKHGFPSILCSSKKDEERNGRLGRLRRPGLVASADELRGLRKVCQLQCPCVEFVLDSHTLELRVLGLTSVWKTVSQNPSGTWSNMPISAKKVMGPEWFKRANDAKTVWQFW
jgi:hypothetical protein